MSIIGLGDGQTLLVGRPYLARVTGAESVRTSRFADAMLAAGFRRAGGFLRGAALDPADFAVTQLDGAYATQLVFERDREESVRETRAAIAIAVWQSGGGRPSAVEVGEARADAADAPEGEPPGLGDLVGQGLDTVKTIAQLPLYLAIAGIVGFGIYLYATSK